MERKLKEDENLIKNGAVLWDAPIGTLHIGADKAGICRISLGQGSVVEPGTDEVSEYLRQVTRELDEYFAGKRSTFEVPLSFHGTEFQKKVWQALQNIPYGETRSYGEIAKWIGCPKAARAVGMAIHRNPVMILIPCHRVIGKDGSLTGYAGGLAVKKFLLELEKGK